MKIVEKIKSIYINHIEKNREIEILNKFKRRINIINNELVISNIDMELVKNKEEIVNHIANIIKDNHICNVMFKDCSLNSIQLDNLRNKKIYFNNCNIKNIKIYESENSKTEFINCNIELSNNSYTIIKTSNVCLESCNINNIDSNNEIELGKNSESKVTIDKLNATNNNLFIIDTCSKKLKFYKVNEQCNFELYNNIDIDVLHISDSKVKFVNDKPLNINMALIENSTIDNLVVECNSLEFIDECNLINSNILKCKDIGLNDNSLLTLNNSSIKSNILECQENSEINDKTNKFTWLKNIDNIVVSNGVKLKCDGKVTYEKNNILDVKIDEDLVEVFENIDVKRR
ncbi:MAG: hypothetical protein E7166_03030 [Firmicutes bacterium]|nr:hypothetical protein [Bacillota bacterium]